MLPPTSQDLLLDETKPYFLWWADATVGELRRNLTSGSDEDRAYWLGALMREANSRDVWLYTSPARIRAMWTLLWRHLGKSRSMWAYLLDLPSPPAASHVA